MAAFAAPPPNTQYGAIEGKMAVPSAPPMDNIGGYEGLTFDGLPAAPPSYFEATDTGPPKERPTAESCVQLTEEEVRGALADFVSQNCCYGKKPAQECKINGIEPACAFHYTLETYAERRDTCWVSEPYDGQVVDGPFNGPAPSPWQVQIFNNIPPYKDGTINCEVPHTASVKPCHSCVGMGRKPCRHCMSMGKVRCPHCNPHHHHDHHGHHHHHDHHHHHHDDHHHNHCISCDGCGWKQCMHCHGSGQMRCDTCKGLAQLKCYIKLTVTFKNHIDEFLLDKTQNSRLPEHVIKQGEGQTAYEESAPRVWPMAPGFPEGEIVAASRRIVDQHSIAFPNELIHTQRQRVRAIPISRVFCCHKQEEKQFYVYGLENKVYFPDYYQKCCGCCCTIL